MDIHSSPDDKESEQARQRDLTLLALLVLLFLLRPYFTCYKESEQSRQTSLDHIRKQYVYVSTRQHTSAYVSICT
jgi:hypothetical protein